jgi:hypothetical protein
VTPAERERAQQSERRRCDPETEHALRAPPASSGSNDVNREQGPHECGRGRGGNRKLWAHEPERRRAYEDDGDRHPPLVG